MRRRLSNDPAGAITTGLILITIGLVFLFSQLDLISVHAVWRYWPLALIAVGLSRLMAGGGWECGLNGVTEVLMGVAFLAITFHWWGIGWREGWPLILVSVGLGTMTRALARRPAPRSSGATVVEEERHG